MVSRVDSGGVAPDKLQDRIGDFKERGSLDPFGLVGAPERAESHGVSLLLIWGVFTGEEFLTA